MQDRTRRRLLTVGALVVAASAMAYLAVGQIGDSLVYYWSPTELIEAGDQAQGATVRLGGLVEAGSIRYGSDGRTLTFAVTDGASRVPVRANAVPPAMFREGIGVVVEGTMAGDDFETHRLMVKHDNEYRAPEEGDDRDVEDLMQTMQFDEASTG